jgi:hypothetical protein
MLEVMDPSGLLDSPVFVIAGVAKSDESSGISGIGHVREEIRPEIICAVIDRERLTFGRHIDADRTEYEDLVRRTGVQSLGDPRPLRMAAIWSSVSPI